MQERNKQQPVINDEIYLEFRVGPLHFCASALEVVSIISPPKMIHVPLSSDIVASCFNHHNETVTVLSMHTKFGLPFTLSENKTHIILARVEDELKGFWVDQAIDIVPLNSFESNADYYPCEGKAYSNFLTRNDAIVLQTSFQRLYECARSNLNWIASAGKSEKEKIEESMSIEVEEVATQVEEVATQDKISIGDDNISAEVEAIELPSESIGVSHNVIEARREANRNDSQRATSSENTKSFNSNTTNLAYTGNRNVAHNYDSSGQANTKHSTAFNSGATSGAYADSRNVASTASQSYSSTSISPDTYSNNTTDVIEIDDKAVQKRPWFLALSVVMLVLFVIGLANYLFDTDVDSTGRNSKKIASEQHSYITSKTSEYMRKESVYTSVDNINKITNSVEESSQDELITEEIKPSENESLNKVAQEDESMLERSKVGRVFELHVDEKSDTNLYAITSFEPVADQQDNTQEKQQSLPVTQQFTHVVVKGDTLWHITRRYLDNPYRYPELAAASHINNPHRIYPGDVIKIIVSRSNTN